MAHIAYARVSTIEQSIDRQLEAFKAYDIQKTFIDKLSGKVMDRPEFNSMNSYIRAGDTLVVKSIDRIGRTMSYVINYIDGLHKKEIGFICIDAPLFNFEASKKLSTLSQMMLSVVAGIAQIERELMLSRQAEGIALAKQKGMYMGRKPIKLDKLIEIEKLVKEGFPVNRACKKFGISTPTYYKYLKNKH